MALLGKLFGDGQSKFIRRAQRVVEEINAKEAEYATQSADELRAQSNISIAELLSLLTDLEIKGVVEKNDEGKYHIN